MSVIRVVGLDLSLRSSGIARATVDGGKLATFTDSIGREPDTRPTLLQRWMRLDWTRDQIADAVGLNGPAELWPDLTVVEGPAPSKAANAHGDHLAGSRWLILDRLLSAGLQVVLVSPGTLKAYATGNGRASKAEVLAAVRKRYGDRFTIPTGHAAEDVADAIALAAMGARALDHPIDSLPEQHTRAMRTPRWPDTERTTSPS